MNKGLRLVIQFDETDKKETVRKLLKYWSALQGDKMSDVLYEKLKESYPEDIKKFEKQ
jgi:hypothetical protein